MLQVLLGVGADWRVCLLQSLGGHDCTMVGKVVASHHAILSRNAMSAQQQSGPTHFACQLICKHCGVFISRLGALWSVSASVPTCAPGYDSACDLSLHPGSRTPMYVSPLALHRLFQRGPVDAGDEVMSKTQMKKQRRVS